MTNAQACGLAAIVVAALVVNACAAGVGRQAVGREIVAPRRPRVVLKGPVWLVKPGMASFTAEIVNADRLEWCPTAVAWEFSNGGGDAFDVECMDRSWSADRRFDYGHWTVAFRIYSNGALVQSVSMTVDVGGARPIAGGQ